MTKTTSPISTSREKIGLGVITYNRPEYFGWVLESLQDNDWGGADIKMVVNDGSDVDYPNVPSGIHYRYQPNAGCANAKNQIIELMLDYGCTHIFVMEDDILMISPETCKAYVDYAKEKKLKHLNFGIHGVMNKAHKRFEYRGISCFPDCVGAFSYYHKSCFTRVGLLDENFKNAWEHVEHTWRLAEKKMTTPFWAFADHPESEKYLGQIKGSDVNSTISKRSDRHENIKKGKEYWLKKHGKFLPPRIIPR